MKQNFTIGIENANYTIRRYIRTHFPHLSQDNIHKSIRQGDIRVNGQKIDIEHILKVRDVVAIWDILVYPAEPRELSREDEYEFLKPLRIDARKDLWCFNKPKGLAMQGGTGVKINMAYLLTHWMQKYNAYPHLVHRLDKDTSGCCIIGTNSESAYQLTTLFATREMKKHYLAICEPHTLKSTLKPSGYISSNIDGQEAYTEYKVEMEFIPEQSNPALRYYYKYQIPLSIVSFYPVTGRKHQIRKHIQDLNWSILGDEAYYPETRYKQMCLHSSEISFEGNDAVAAFHYKADLPKHMQIF